MAKLYGKGTVTEIERGKKYRIALSAGKDPASGRVYASGQDIPADALAIDDRGKYVNPRLRFGDATAEQKAMYSQWKMSVKYLRVQETFLGTKRQAELRVEELRRELEGGIRPNASRITFADWCEEYLSTREKMEKCRPSTLRRDRGLSKHLLKGLGSAQVMDITPAMVNSLYASMRASGVGDTTVKQCHRLLKAIMKQAVNNDLIMRNPVERAESPRSPKPNRQALGTEDANRLAALCASGAPTANKTAVYLGLSLGARLGEVLGLEWRHIELEGDRPFVNIAQQFTEQGDTAPLKTDKDDNPTGRIVPIDAPTVSALAAWRVAQKSQLNELGVEQGSKTPIVTNACGTYTSHTRFQRWWRSFCVDNGFGRMATPDGKTIKELTIGDDAALYPDCYIMWRDADGWPCDENGKRYSRTHKRPEVKARYDGLHFHSLRHTHFSMRLASGMDIPTAQALGGWSTPAMLLNVYAHPVSENIWSSAGFMERLAEQGGNARGARFAHDLLNYRPENQTGQSE